MTSNRMNQGGGVGRGASEEPPSQVIGRGRPKRVLLVLPTSTYRAADFIDAASELGAEVVVASEEGQALAGAMGDRFVQVDLCRPALAAATVVNRAGPLDAAIGVDEQGVEVAAEVSALLGLKGNPPGAVEITRDKAKMRRALGEAGLAQPRVFTGPPSFPCVVKATTLSGSRGVIRADDAASFDAALRRVKDIAGGGDVLVEEYVPGAEIALEGILKDGELTVLALFDKPDPLEGPYFEETIYVTPSRLTGEVQQAIAGVVERSCQAIGLSEGPIHAELRLSDVAPRERPPRESKPVLLEVAARSIGGLCSRALRFGAGISLEEVILRHALDLPLGDLSRSRAASGVMMIPIPRSGVLSSVRGAEEARRLEGVDGLDITIPAGQPVKALPEGDRYLGFIFASGADPENVESTLREAYSLLRIEIGEGSG